MELKAFKAGYWQPQIGYRSFQPYPVNHTFTWDDPELNMLLEEATLKLGALNTYSEWVPNIDLFIQMHVVKEATQSSRIEGTKTAMDEALMRKEDLLPERRDDWDEVHNYIDAMNGAIAELERLPLSLRLLRQTHKQLMQGVRGQHKSPGAFRTSQNWIGGASLRDAAFVPPQPPRRTKPDGRPRILLAQQGGTGAAPHQNSHRALSIRNHPPVSGRQRPAGTAHDYALPGE